MFKALFTTVVLAMAGFAPTAAWADQEQEKRNKALIEDKFSAWAAGTGSPYELLSEEATWTIGGRSLASRTYGSREEFMREVIRPFNRRMSVGLRPTIRSILAEGNTVVVRFDAQGTARDGVRYENSYAWFLEMREGRIMKSWALFDSVTFNDFWQRVSPVSE